MLLSQASVLCTSTFASMYSSCMLVVCVYVFQSVKDSQIALTQCNARAFELAYSAKMHNVLHRQLCRLHPRIHSAYFAHIKVSLEAVDDYQKHQLLYTTYRVVSGSHIGYMHCCATGQSKQSALDEDRPAAECSLKPASILSFPANSSRVSSQSRQSRLPRLPGIAPGQPNKNCCCCCDVGNHAC